MAVKFGIQEVSITLLLGPGPIRRRRYDTQLRVENNYSKAQQYAEEMREGDDFPPPVVFYDSHNQTWHVGDGYHRILANELNEKTTVLVEVRPGTRLTAMLHCLQVNAIEQRGIPFIRGDKVNAILQLLGDPVAGKWTMMKLARAVGCNVATVQYAVKSRRIERPEKVINEKGQQVPSSQFRPTVQEAEERREKVKKLKVEGLSHKEIADRTGLSAKQVEYTAKTLVLNAELVECPMCHGTGRISPLANN